MMMIKQAAILALIGSALAAPLAHRGSDADGPRTGRQPGNYGFDTTTQTVTVTDIVYVDQNGNVLENYNPNGQTTTPTVTVTGSGSGSGSGTDTSSGSDASSSPAVPAAGTGSQTGYMAVVAKWRAAGGLPALTESSKLVANALKTVQDGNGRMQHELNPGTMGQVLAPGNANDFEKVYVGGWLCEDPSLPGLNGICATMTAGWDHSSGEKGHAEILTNPGYKNIGCALADGIWGCDFS